MHESTHIYFYKKYLRVVNFFITVAVILLSPSLVSANENIYREHQMKALYLMRMVDYITWPKKNDMEGSVNICVYGEHPVGSHLKQFENKVINSMTLRISNNLIKANIHKCNIVFVGKNQEEKFLMNNKLDLINDALIVGEGYRYINNGGMFSLCINNNKVKIVINKKMVNESNIKISSKLFRVAEMVN